MLRGMDRRQFVAAAAATGLGAAWSATTVADDKPAILGGKPVRSAGYRSWPVPTPADERDVLDAVRTGRWYRGTSVEQFENAFARINGAKHCIAVSSGTAALCASLGALGVGPGDEVIVPPYTFLATVSVVLMHYAMPVFVDVDRRTFLMDPDKLEAAISERTAAIVPVHIGGAPCDMQRISAIAQKRNIPLIEDACQAHLASVDNRSVGTWGTAGCFSFQVSKNLPSGEGGAILTNDSQMADACYAFHNCGRKRPGGRGDYRLGRNSNFRMTEFQGALLLAQLEGIEARAQTRTRNAEYLDALLREIPGIVPAQPCNGATRNAYHMYMFRYRADEFGGLPRNKFVRALRAEGIPCSTGYERLNEAAFLRDALQSRHYVRIYGRGAIDSWAERNRCPENDQLCDEAVWLMQNMLLGPRTDMEEIAAAVRKIRAHAAALVN